MEVQADTGLYVQFGCGNSAPTGWRNFDASPTLKLQRLPVIGKHVAHDKINFPAAVEFGGVRKGLPVPDQSCAGVYASNVLEHLALVNFEKALLETYRILRLGGQFRFVMPYLAYVIASHICRRIATATLMPAAASCAKHIVAMIGAPVGRTGRGSPRFRTTATCGCGTFPE